MKKALVFTLIITAYIITIWAGIIGIDYARAQAQKAPLFSIGDASGPDGDIAYFGLGYVVIHYNPFSGQTGHADFKFAFYMDGDTIKNAIYPLFIMMLPVAFCFFMHKLKPKLLFLTPILATIALIPIGWLLLDFVRFDLSPDIREWFVIIILAYFTAVTIAFYMIGKVKKRKKLKSGGSTI